MHLQRSIQLGWVVSLQVLKKCCTNAHKYMHIQKSHNGEMGRIVENNIANYCVRVFLLFSFNLIKFHVVNHSLSLSHSPFYINGLFPFFGIPTVFFFLIFCLSRLRLWQWVVALALKSSLSITLIFNCFYFDFACRNISSSFFFVRTSSLSHAVFRMCVFVCVQDSMCVFLVIKWKCVRHVTYAFCQNTIAASL